MLTFQVQVPNEAAMRYIRTAVERGLGCRNEGQLERATGFTLDQVVAQVCQEPKVLTSFSQELSKRLQLALSATEEDRKWDNLNDLDHIVQDAWDRVPSKVLKDRASKVSLNYATERAFQKELAKKRVAHERSLREKAKRQVLKLELPAFESSQHEEAFLQELRTSFCAKRLTEGVTAKTEEA